MTKLYDVLEVCIQDIENGADIETVLFRYPEFAEELRPILETALRAKDVAASDPAPDVVRRNRAKVLQHAARLREAKTQPSRSFWSVTLRRALVSLAVIAMLFISSTGLVRASSTTVPGDNLYPVKRTWEDVLVLFTFDLETREALEVEHENERLEELNELFARGRSVRVDFAGLVTRQNGDLWRVAGIPVVLPAEVDVRGPVTVGDAVRVRGITQVDGSILAERVDLLGAGVPLPDVDDDWQEIDESDSGNGSGVEPTERRNADIEREKTTLEGRVDSVNGNILIVGGQSVDISNAEVKGSPATGRRAKVEGYYDGGMFIVTKIEFFQNDSSGGNSGPDDNDNDSNDDSGDDNSNDDDDEEDDEGGGDDGNDNNSGSGGGDDD